MTREECQNQTTLSKLWRGSELKLFDKIDTNKNGILEDTEICDQRDIEVNNMKIAKIGAGALGVAQVASCPWIGIPLMALCLFGKGFAFNKLDEEQRQTNAYRQEKLNKTA